MLDVVAKHESGHASSSSSREHTHQATPWLRSTALSLAGGVTITPKEEPIDDSTSCHAKPEPAEPLIDGLEIGQPKRLGDATPSDSSAPVYDDLSEYAKAAIDSLRARNSKKSWFQCEEACWHAG